MAKKKTITTVEEVPEAPDTLEQIEGEQIPPDIDNVVRELGDEINKVILHKRGRDGKQKYLTTLDADEFTIDYVASHFGGGRYLARLSKPGGGILFSRAFDIDDSIKPHPEVEVNAKSESSEIVSLLKDVLKDRMAAPVKDPMEIAAAIAQAQGTQMQATMTMLMPLLEKLMGGATQKTNVTELIEALAALDEMRGSSGGDGMGPVIKELGIPLLKLLDRATPGKGTVPMTPNPAGTPAPADANTPPWVAMLKPWIPKLIEFATRNDDPSMWAAVVDTTYPRLSRWLEATLGSPGGALLETQLYQFFPPLGQHQAWVTRFLDEFRLGEAEEGEEGEEAELPEGDETPL